MCRAQITAISQGWIPRHGHHPSPRLWTDDVGGQKGFAGTGVYLHEFPLPPNEEGNKMVLELETVRDIARVVVNDIDCGVAWTSPYQVDVSSTPSP